MPERTGPPQFALEAKVECNCGVWEVGTVIGHDYTDDRLDFVCPYQVRLEDGRVFCVPLDGVTPAARRAHRLAWRADTPLCRLRSAASVRMSRRRRRRTMTTTTAQKARMRTSRARGNT